MYLLKFQNRIARSAPRLLLLVATLATLAAWPSMLRAEEVSTQQPGCQTFKETGKQACGSFLQYWQTHGGLPLQGFPITNEMKEVSQIDGKTYTVQYFERAVFEMHPENKPPYDVLLSLLGTLQYRENYPKGGALELSPSKSDAARLFTQTGKYVWGSFLTYWQANGGLMQFGYPISQPIVEQFDCNGGQCPDSIWARRGAGTLMVQYFERAVFEMHPENKPPYDVLLSQLGTLQLQRNQSTPIPTPDPYAMLSQRPLNVPKLAPGATCPKATGKTVSPDFGPAIGSGPVYAAGFGTEGIMHLAGAQEEGGWLYAKVLWIADPKYRGPILIRGRQADGPNEMRFERSPDPARELRLHTDTGGNSSSGWRNWPTYTRLRGPGCYAYQVDGTDFNELIFFQAVE